ncbi:MAG: S1C family serine protease [Rhizomicrobium sp.]|nr:S1C family serine protease [Rhizomicrobium sp.]
MPQPALIAASWMTKFHSKQQAVLSLALLVLLSGCVVRSGVPVDGALTPALAYAYIPLKTTSPLYPESDAGGVALGGGIAVSVAHAKKYLPPALLIGISRDCDLMFFHTDRTQAVLEKDVPHVGEKVIAYAQYEGVPYRAEGTVTALGAAVLPRCESCVAQTAFVFEGNAGPGYSGGPVLDAATGKLLGIVFGYLDPPQGPRLIYAYPLSRVDAELKVVQAEKTSPP